MLKKKILIIDDEPDYCMIMKSYFVRKGFEVHIAPTLREGMDQLKSLQPEILFLDNNLPDGKGWLMLDEILLARPGLRVYLVSAFRQEFDFINPSDQVTIWEKPISISSLATVE